MLILWSLPLDASGHAGRRFTVEVVNNQIQVQGINTGPYDGAPALRPYVNSLHDHFRNVPAANAALASLPGYDIPAFTVPLVGKRLELSWTAAHKWMNPPLEPTAATHPIFQPLDEGERIMIFGPLTDANSDDLGTLLLSEELSVSGATDVDLVYQINSLPSQVLYLLTFEMTAPHVDGTPSDVIGSDPIYVTLAPDGDTSEDRLQLAALFLESYMVNVPEPSLAAPWSVLLVLILIRRAQRSKLRS